MPDTSGPSSLTPLAFYDPDSSCWKMSAGTFPWEPPPCLETLPASGMTLDGRLYELPMSVPATDEPDCSSLPTPRAMLPTPTVMDDAGTMYRNPRASADFDTHHAVTLSQVAYKRLYSDLLPTPSAADGMGGHERRGGDRGDELLLAGLVKDVLLPTPRTSDANGTGTHGDGGPDLRTTVDRMLPTPTARDHKGHNQRHDETCLTGALTAPPSSDTPPCSDDPPLTLWTAKDD